MKDILLFILVLCSLNACNKDDALTAENEKLEGYWLLTEVTGGFGGTGYEVNFDHLQINEDQRYSLMVHDSFIQEGTYQLSMKDDQLIIKFIPSVMNTIAFDDYEKAIKFNENDNVLTLSDPCCDLFVYTFSKEE